MTQYRLSALSTFITHELRVLFREGTFLTLLAIFFVVTLFSVFIGWATRTTILGIYTATVKVLHDAGVTHIAANPVAGASALSIFNNLIIYTLLVGALLAIVIGHRSFIRDRKSGVLPLLLSRRTGRPLYIAGKLFGVGIVLALVVVGMFSISALSTFLVPAIHLSGTELFSLFVFYSISFLYLAFFAITGFLFAILVSNESLALLVPVMIWISIVFILPELSSGQNPVSLLNPVTLAAAPTPSGAVFSLLNTVLGPLSLGQSYTALSLQFLHVGSVHGSPGDLILIIVACILAIGGSSFALRRYAVTTDEMS